MPQPSNELSPKSETEQLAFLPSEKLCILQNQSRTYLLQEAFCDYHLNPSQSKMSRSEGWAVLPGEEQCSGKKAPGWRT